MFNILPTPAPSTLQADSTGVYWVDAFGRRRTDAIRLPPIATIGRNPVSMHADKVHPVADAILSTRRALFLLD